MPQTDGYPAFEQAMTWLRETREKHAGPRGTRRTLSIGATATVMSRLGLPPFTDDGKMLQIPAFVLPFVDELAAKLATGEI